LLFGDSEAFDQRSPGITVTGVFAKEMGANSKLNPKAWIMMRLIAIAII